MQRTLETYGYDVLATRDVKHALQIVGTMENRFSFC